MDRREFNIFRVNNGISVNDLSKSSQVSVQDILSYEHGKETSEEIVDRLELSLEILFKERELVLPESPSAAQQVTEVLWKSKKGNLFKDEFLARQDGATHRLCKCGEIMLKHKHLCEKCLEENNRERYNALPEAPTDWQYPIFIYQSDIVFWDEDELEDYCEEENVNKEDLQLVEHVKEKYRTVPEDYFELPEDAYLPKEIQEKLDALNEAIRTYPNPMCYYAGNKRIKFS